MSVSADSARLGVVRMAGDPPATPSNPVFKVVRMTGEGVGVNNTFQSSNELDPSGQVRDAYIVDASSSGPINFEITDHDGLAELMAGVFGAEWSGSPSRLIPGTTVFYYLLEKTFTLAGGVNKSYHRFDKTAFTDISLNIAPGSPITGSFTAAGGVASFDTSIIAGATYPDPGTAGVLQPHKVVVQVGALTETYGSVGITLTNNTEDRKAVGVLGAIDKRRGRFEGQITAQLYYEDNAVLSLIEAQTEVAVTVTLKTLAGVNAFVFEFPRCAIVNGPVVAGGTGQDVVVDATIAAKYSAGSGYTCRITRGV